MLQKLPPFVKNFYFITGISFLLWILFFDSNDVISQFKMSRKLSELESEVTYYEQKIEEVISERKGLLSNREELERFARETYLMKKENEIVFVIQKED
jgi:cell division protein DivIC